MLNGMLKRLSKFNENSIDTVKENKKKKRNKNKLWMQGKTPEEIEEIQRKLLENAGMSDSEGNQEATSNESPTHPLNSSNENTTPMQTSTVLNESETMQYWSDYKNNWISHNQALLDKEYQEWV